jgi:hypothetical protein
LVFLTGDALLVGLAGAAAVITLGILTLTTPTKTLPLAGASSSVSFFYSPPLETFVCSLAEVSRADRASRVTSGACVLDYLLPRDLQTYLGGFPQLSVVVRAVRVVAVIDVFNLGS